MAKKEEAKMSTKEIIDKVMETLNILALPVCSVIAVWSGFDTTMYVLGAVEVVNCALEYAKKCIKD